MTSHLRRAFAPLFSVSLMLAAGSPPVLAQYHDTQIRLPSRWQAQNVPADPAVWTPSPASQPEASLLVPAAENTRPTPIETAREDNPWSNYGVELMYQKDNPACKSCGKGCCANCCYDPCARWTFSAGALVMRRSNPADVILFSNAEPDVGPEEILSGGDFNFDYEFGFEVGIRKHNVFRGWDIEANYFQINDWSATGAANIVTPGDTQLPDGSFATVIQIHTDPLSFFPGPAYLTSTYSSDLMSFELNGRKRSQHWKRVEWIAGFRMIKLDEELATKIINDAGPCCYPVYTSNNLYGGQIGAQLDIISNCNWCVRGVLKGGIYGTDSDHRTEAICNENFIFPAEGSANDVAFVGEMGISVKYCLCGIRGLALRADYRAFWIDGVALASDQIAVTPQLNTAGVYGIDNGGSVFYHGLFLGAEYRF